LLYQNVMLRQAQQDVLIEQDNFYDLLKEKPLSFTKPPPPILQTGILSSITTPVVASLVPYPRSAAATASSRRTSSSLLGKKGRSSAGSVSVRE